jgi:Fe2+ transport system protein B
LDGEPQRNLYFATQVIESATPIVALNMMDVARGTGRDRCRAASENGVPVFPIVASRGEA